MSERELSIRQELRIIRSSISRLETVTRLLEQQNQELARRITEVTNVAQDAVSFAIQTRYLVSLSTRYGAAGALGAGVLAALTGIGRGVEAARETVRIGEIVRRGEVRWGTQADMDRWAWEQSLRIAMKMLVG